MKKADHLPPVEPVKYKHVFSNVVFGVDGNPGLMKQAGLSTREFAELSGIKLPNLYPFKRGDRFPSHETAEKFAKALGIPFEDFVKLIVMRYRSSHHPDLVVFGVRRKCVDRAWVENRDKSAFLHRADLERERMESFNTQQSWL